jgi:hypothetical protein
LFEFADERGARDVRLNFQPDALAFHFEKRFGVFQTKRAGQLRVIAENGMNVEREVGAVDGEVVLERALEQAPASAGYWLEARPEESVMHNEKVYSALDGGVDRASGSIDRRSEFRDAAGILELQTVQSIRPVGDFTEAQMFVGVGNDLSQ